MTGISIDTRAISLLFLLELQTEKRMNLGNNSVFRLLHQNQFRLNHAQHLHLLGILITPFRTTQTILPTSKACITEYC